MEDEDPEGIIDEGFDVVNDEDPDEDPVAGLLTRATDTIQECFDDLKKSSTAMTKKLIA